MKQPTRKALTFFLLLALVSVSVGQQSAFTVYANEEGAPVVGGESDSQETKELVEKPDVNIEAVPQTDETSEKEEVESDDEDVATDLEPKSSETESEDAEEAASTTDTEEVNDTNVASITKENDSTSSLGDTTSSAPASTTAATTSLSASTQIVALSAELAQNASTTGSSSSSATNETDTQSSSDSASSSPASTTAATSSLATSTQTVASSSAVTQNASTTGASSSTQATTTKIVTGGAVATANVLTIANTNLVNSTGEIIFSNLLEDQTGGIDFRNSSGTGCQFSTCGNSNSVEVRLLNDAYIANAIMLEATTGNNQIDGADNGVNGSIKTGDAFAGLNLINVANTNFIDSNYLLVTLNAFKNVHGDIVFPGFANFFNQYASMAYAESTSSIYNDGVIENNLQLETQTGNNQTQSSDGSIINSGAAHATSNIFNQLNSSLLGGNSVSILLRVHGSWLGEVFGMPEGMNLIAGNDGYYYISNSSFGNGTRSALSVNASNTAAIYNDVSLSAVTGNNTVTGVQNASIDTGNALVGANIVNIANANVIGRNWTMAILNIFGDFTGNISFGQPDLWVGGQVEVPSTIKNGSELTYVFTLTNNGDAPATNVKLADTYDGAHLEIIDSSHAYTQTAENTLSWDVGRLAPGEATEISYRTRVVNTTPGTNITNTVESTLRETDGNYIDNTDTATVQTTLKSGSSGSSVTRSTSRQQSVEQSSGDLSEQAIENISVDRVTSASILAPDEYTAVQTLVVSNPQNKYIKDVVLTDTLYGPDGGLLKEEVWEIGDVLPFEEITLSYQMEFADTAAAGVYTLTTVVREGEGSEKRFAKNGQIELLGLTAPEEIVSEDSKFEIATSGFVLKPIVMGAMTHTEVPAYLDESEPDDFSLATLFSTHLAYADSGDVKQPMKVSGNTAPYPLFILSMIILLVLGLYRYSARRRFR